MRCQGLKSCALSYSLCIGFQKQLNHVMEEVSKLMSLMQVQSTVFSVVEIVKNYPAVLPLSHMQYLPYWVLFSMLISDR